MFKTEGQFAHKLQRSAQGKHREDFIIRRRRSPEDQILAEGYPDYTANAITSDEAAAAYREAAAGDASPAMVIDPREAAQFAAIADALLINVGTLTEDREIGRAHV